MCGRFSLQIDAQALAEHFQLAHSDGLYQAHYNISPGQGIAIIRENPQHERYLEHAHWGLIPSWAKDRRIANKLINARAETVEEKPAFRTAFARRRCLIPADGFYEWRLEDGKQPYRILPADHQVFAFAGLWEHWESPETGGLVESCTILTVEASPGIQYIHPRMPVILPVAAYQTWLDPHSAPAQLKALLRPYDPPLEHFPVSRELNNPRHDTQELLRPL